MSFSMSLAECADILQARLTGDDDTVSGVSIDSRTLNPGDLYVAIKGERHDGHQFVSAAGDAGASAVLVHNAVDTPLPQLLVQDTQVALGQLARAWARRFSIPTIAITGSNGKTTVKEIIALILGQLGPVLATRGNLNNEIGVPLTLLRMRMEHMYAVVEMGANHAGEISRLVAMAEPDVALVNNIGSAHLEGFGSKEGIAAAKAEIYAGLSTDGYAVINADDEFAGVMREAASHCQIREFGIVADANVKGVVSERFEIHSMDRVLAPRFNLSGEHNLMNALAAVAAVQCLDVSSDKILQGLESIDAVPGRLQRKKGIHGALVIDDSYNANPDSVRSAIRVLAACSGKRYLVLGDMAELGSDSSQLHHDIGHAASEHGIDGVWTVGALSANTRKAFVDRTDRGSSNSVVDDPNESVTGAHCTDKNSLIDDLRQHLTSDVTVLIKGSRSAHMEYVVDALCPSDQKPDFQRSVESGS
ncbi:MAG: UDP-N-acetylmuramoyl-tripeptide--D-alanyl-D-alanine ligase [Granulosicoccus sp.]|nr:UDP-N-acetylmuramoyl-tripeptide--D-alanyl-D-alanine ligase [Granulosicoccus sp.]